MPIGKCRLLRAIRLLACGLAVLGMSLLTAGCWDRVEIQDRAFVMAVAMDTPDAQRSDPGEQQLESYARNGPPDRLLVSIQLLKLGGGKGTEEGEKGGGGGKTYVVTGEGISMLGIVRNILGGSSKGLWFENIQTVILSESLVRKYGLEPLVDFWRRDAEMRWGLRFFVTGGEARKLLEYQPPTGEPGGIFLANLLKRQQKTPEIAGAKTNLAYTSQALDTGEDIILPRLEVAGKTAKVKGAALFKKDKFVGYIDEYTVKGIRLGRGNEKSAVITFECPLHPGNTVVFELFRHNTILKPHVEGDNIYFTLDVAMRGNLDEIQDHQKHDTTSTEYLQKAQGLIADEVKRNIEHSLSVTQAMGVDVLYFRQSLKAYKPAAYAKIKDHWDEIFPTIPLVVSVNVSIIEVGEHR